MKKFSIYLEYWSVNPGGGSVEKNLGSYKAKTFQEACEKALEANGYDMNSYDKEKNRYGMFGGLFENSKKK
jgi:hypothetical protein